MKHCIADEVTVFADSKVIGGKKKTGIEQQLENSIMKHGHMLNSSYPNTPTYKQYVRNITRKK